jgi:glyoxylase-like metal-dependent hydrolase (beta-lactamase superfamily II)
VAADPSRSCSRSPATSASTTSTPRSRSRAELTLPNAGPFFFTSDQFHVRDNFEGPAPLGWLLRDHAAWWRSYRKVKTIADRTGARLVFGHDPGPRSAPMGGSTGRRRASAPSARRVRRTRR